MNTKKAVALRYEAQQDAAPRVVAKGAGDVATAIINKAKESGVPTQSNDALVQALMNLELDSVIPEELYAVVAEVLAFVYQGKSR
jgi:flagellar biosynthesis protein